MEDQAKYIYKKVELENVVNINMVKQLIDTDRTDDEEGEINLYH